MLICNCIRIHTNLKNWPFGGRWGALGVDYQWMRF